jgi:hypothetical protein
MKTPCTDWETLAAQFRDTQRQLTEVTAERDRLLAMLQLADALRNAERAKFATGQVVP